MGMQTAGLRHKGGQTAEEAWSSLVEAVESAGENTRHTAHSAKRHAAHLTGKAKRRMGRASDEAQRRATAAADALAGRRQHLPWGLIVGAALAGAAMGWAAATLAGRAPCSPRDAIDFEAETVGVMPGMPH